MHKNTGLSEAFIIKILNSKIIVSSLCPKQNYVFILSENTVLYIIKAHNYKLNTMFNHFNYKKFKKSPKSTNISTSLLVHLQSCGSGLGGGGWLGWEITCTLFLNLSW